MKAWGYVYLFFVVLQILMAIAIPVLIILGIITLVRIL